jgi:hypothetical protein
LNSSLTYGVGCVDASDCVPGITVSISHATGREQNLAERASFPETEEEHHGERCQEEHAEPERARCEVDDRTGPLVSADPLDQLRVDARRLIVAIASHSLVGVPHPT